MARTSCLLAIIALFGTTSANAEIDDAARARKLSRVLAAKPSTDRVDAIRRFLLGLKLRHPDRYKTFIRTVDKLPRARGPKLLRRLAATVTRQEREANLLIVSLGRISSEKPVRQVLRQMRQEKPAQYAQLKATIDAYMSAFMEMYDCFSRSSLYQTFCTRARQTTTAAPAASSLYGPVMAQLGTLRGLFATVESTP